MTKERIWQQLALLLLGAILLLQGCAQLSKPTPIIYTNPAPLTLPPSARQVTTPQELQDSVSTNIDTWATSLQMPSAAASSASGAATPPSPK